MEQQRQGRSKINVLSWCATVALLLLALGLGDGSFSGQIHRIGQNLDRAISRIISENQANYTDIHQNATYVSDASFDSRGMAGLYNFTNAFMELIISKDMVPEGFIKVENNQLRLGDPLQEWQSLLSKFGGLLAVIIIVLLLIVFLPLCGFFFCCCRCCGKCGSRSQPFDKKHDLCKKISLGTVLICLGTMLLFGVVCAFVSNQHMEDGIGDLTDNLRKGVTDVDTYLDTTEKEVHTLLYTNYREFSELINETLDQSSTAVYEELAILTNAIAMTELANVVHWLPELSADLNKLRYSTNSLRTYALQLDDAVRKVKKDLLNTIRSDDCQKIATCRDISKNISSLQTNIHFNKLPDITDKINVLNNFTNDAAILTSVQAAEGKLKSLRDTIRDRVDDAMATTRTEINAAGRKIDEGSSKIIDMIHDLRRTISDGTKPTLNSADNYIRQYGPYRYYVGLAISCVLLTVSLCVTLGLICGICGKRPDGYGDDCCNKGAGSQFLICGVMVMFMSGAILGVVILVTFLLGTVAQRVVCDPMRDPSNSQLFDIVNQADFSSLHINFNISDALVDCYNNKSMYRVFNLSSEFDMGEVQNYLNQFNISDTLKNLTETIDLPLPKNWTLLNPDDAQKLKNFSDEFDDLDFEQFQSLLDENFLTVNLTILTDQLTELITQIQRQGNYDDLAAALSVSKLQIDTYQSKIVEPLIKNATDVIELSNKLETDLTFNRTSFSNAIEGLLREVAEAEDTLRNTATATVRNITLNFTQGLVNQVQGYLDRVVNKTTDEMGQCGPLSLVIRATLTSTCDKILLPWNGFWFGLFWSLLLFVPTIVVSVKLATLYQKHSPYSSAPMETDYLYDAYGGDNIPLNSSRSGNINKKNKKKNKKYKRYEDRPTAVVPTAVAATGGGDAVPPRGAEYPPGGSQDTRYADMAPKHWEEFPAGGPPQYQRAPTEYERPPPYYYPAAGEPQQP